MAAGRPRPPGVAGGSKASGEEFSRRSPGSPRPPLVRQGSRGKRWVACDGDLGGPQGRPGRWAKVCVCGNRVRNSLFWMYLAVQGPSTLLPRFLLLSGAPDGGGVSIFSWAVLISPAAHTASIFSLCCGRMNQPSGGGWLPCLPFPPDLNSARVRATSVLFIVIIIESSRSRAQCPA